MSVELASRLLPVTILVARSENIRHDDEVEIEAIKAGVMGYKRKGDFDDDLEAQLAAAARRANARMRTGWSQGPGGGGRWHYSAARPSDYVTAIRTHKKRYAALTI